jgi:hypothetical protein
MKIIALALLVSMVVSIFNITFAGHISNRKVLQIRAIAPTYVRVKLDGNISNPGCATVLNHIAVDGMDSPWGNQRLSMLMTAMAAGYYVNPNCTTQCIDNWDGKLLVCTEVSIEK